MKATKIGWRCEVCQKQHWQVVRYQFDVAKGPYTMQVWCSQCGKHHEVGFWFQVTPVAKNVKV